MCPKVCVACPSAQSPVCLRSGMPAFRKGGRRPTTLTLDSLPLVGVARRRAQTRTPEAGFPSLAAGPRPDCPSPGPRESPESSSCFELRAGSANCWLRPMCLSRFQEASPAARPRSPGQDGAARAPQLWAPACGPRDMRAGHVGRALDLDVSPRELRGCCQRRLKTDPGASWNPRGGKGSIFDRR